MDIQDSVETISEILERLSSGEARPVDSIIDDYVQLRDETRSLAEAGAFKNEKYVSISEVVAQIIGDFDNNIKMLATSIYNDAQKELSQAKTDEEKLIAVRMAVSQLERIAEYPEHGDHRFLNKTLSALRQWQDKHDRDPQETEVEEVKAKLGITATDRQVRYLLNLKATEAELREIDKKQASALIDKLIKENR